ncbi:MAG: DUF2163 domain-containing protein [Rhodobacteraceae bacterium]|nr:DUF2163 domain-containing protein [Paracoccaceae bacterium]
MRPIPPALQQKLDIGATTLCRCWRLDRPDGLIFGFTDHDRAITFDGLQFTPDAAVSPSALESSDSLDIDSQDIAGALSADAITDADLDRGLYDDANIQRWLVDWTDPNLRVLIFSGFLGEIRRQGAAFTAELRGLSDPLAAPTGRQLLPTCDAALGDARCTVDLNAAAYRTNTVIISSNRRTLRLSGLESFAPGWFTLGRLILAPPDHPAPLNARITVHQRDSVGDLVELEDVPYDPIASGAPATLLAGCDKRHATCAAKFHNLLNFRGFPHVPPEEWIFSYPRAGDANTGGSRAG